MVHARKSVYVLHCEHEADSTHRMRAVHMSKLMDDGRELISDGVFGVEELSKREDVSIRPPNNAPVWQGT